MIIEYLENRNLLAKAGGLDCESSNNPLMINGVDEFCLYSATLPLGKIFSGIGKAIGNGVHCVGQSIILLGEVKSSLRIVLGFVSEGDEDPVMQHTGRFFIIMGEAMKVYSEIASA